MSQIRKGVVLFLFLIAISAVSGCSEGNGNAMLDPVTGEHADNWYTAHRTAYTNDPSVCQECHGADLRGGISQVSCFSASFEGLSCHADGPSGHPAGWASPSSHGTVAKAAPDTSAGFASCQVCHGEDFTGGAVDRSCFTCHDVEAPHPAPPWREGGLTHTNTNPANAIVCALCHQRPSLPQGTTPGCFNNTLCHGNEHAPGWSAGSVHGEAAQEDFTACTECHGETYRGTAEVSTSCYDCHNGPGLDHPAPQWVVSDHAAAASNNIASCQECHGTNYLGGGAHVACTSCHLDSPNAVHFLNWYPDIRRNHGPYVSANGPASCSTEYCHGTDLGGVAQSGPACTTCHTWPYEGAHPGGWSAGEVHGAQAKQDFSVCTVCHGDTYQGGQGATTTCYECHNGPGLNHPAPQWVINDHATAATNNIALCQECHGTNYQGGGSHVACTSCHMEDETVVHRVSWYPDIKQNHGPYVSANGPASCSTEYCHGTNLGGVAQSGPSCSTCHTWPYEGAHPAGWSAGSVHGIQAEQDFSACKACHGNTYQGGNVASTSCYQCHNGPGLNHPAPQWVISNHATSALNDVVSCQVCHGTNYQGGGTGVACTSCHLGNETNIHPVNWYPDIQLNHRAYASANGTASCATTYCHGTDLGGVAGSGPSCSTCHTWPFTGGTCTNCHGTPPDGNAFPNEAGRHAVHTALNGVDCAVCHQNAGSGTPLHQNGVVNIAFNSTYNAESGTASFNTNAVTCSTVSCHGGQTTPYWVTGSINVDTQCTSCHSSGTSQYNSYNSGKHNKHSPFPCYECHDTTRLQPVHFNDLNTTQMNEASQTIRLDANYTGGRCSIVCHNKTHNNYSW